MKRKAFSKIILSILLVAAMLATLMPMSAMAAKDSNDKVTAAVFTLSDYGYGEATSTCTAYCEEQWTAIVNLNVSGILEYIDGEFEYTDDDYFNAGKQYYYGLVFAAHMDSAGFADSFIPENATLKLNGAACEFVESNNTTFDDEPAYASVYKLPVLEVVPMGINYTINVEQGGSIAPKSGEFELEILNVDEGSNSPIADYTIGGKTASTNGKGSFDSKLTVGNNDFQKTLNLFSEGILVRQKKGTAEGWTYDESIWAVTLHHDQEVNSLDDTAKTMKQYTFDCFKGKIVDGEFKPDSETAADKITFTNTYTENEPEHTHSFTLKHNETDHWNECDCGAVENKEAHQFGEWKVTTEATETAKGAKEHTCSVCGYSETAEIDMLPKVEVPQTGENSPLALWIALLFISGTGVVGATAFSRKRKATK